MSEEINTSELKKSIWHNRMFIVICIASVIVAVGIFILLVNGYINKRYTGYERKDRDRMPGRKSISPVGIISSNTVKTVFPGLISMEKHCGPEAMK